MKPQSNWLVDLHDSKNRESVCFKLMDFIYKEAETLGITYTEKHEALCHLRLAQMKAGGCAYRGKCPIYAKTMKKIGSIQLRLF